MKYPDLFVDVNARVKALRLQVSDAEWNASPDAGRLRSELARYERLQSEGVTLEPKF